MPRLIAFPDIHDRFNQLRDIRHVLADVDAVLLAGDMTNGNVENLNKLLALIEQYNENILAVCGNMDTEKMNMGMAREGISIHRKHEIVGDIAILGCGGALPFAGKYVFNEDQLASFLADSIVGVPDDMPKVLLCHQPPYGTSVDLVGEQHVGSHAVREFIERVQPLICFCGHIHEATGIDTIGKTQIINAGPIWQTEHYAYVEIEDGVVKTLDIRKLEALNLQSFD